MEKKSVFNGFLARYYLKKLCLMMRLMTFIVLVSVFVANANTASSQVGKLNLSFQKASLTEVFERLEQELNIGFLLPAEIVNDDREINLTFKDAKIETILKEVLDVEIYRYEFVGKNIVITKKQSVQQSKDVAGKITDNSGLPLPGVTIVIKGTTRGTITDSDGNYSLSDVPSDGILVFSFVGMATQEIPITGKSSIDVIMKEDAIGIEEVIAIGYGTIKKSDLTGAVRRMEGEDFRTQPLTQITEMLSGTVAGFNTVQGTSAAGGGTLEIRGPNSLSANSDPLIVLDGAIYNGSLRDINPMDIESIDILKDASSAAVFGAKAASGVLIITTTKGTTGRPVINFSAKIGYAEVTNDDIKPYDAEGFLDFRRDFLRMTYPDQPQYYFFNPNSLPNDISTDEWLNYSNNPNADPETEWLSRLLLTNIEMTNYQAGNTVNWYDKVMQKGIRQSYDVSINGGSPKISYYWSLGYTNNEGIIVGDQFKVIRSRLNFTADIADFMKVGINSQFSYRDESSVPAELDVAMVNTPYGSMFNEDGTLKWYPNDISNGINPLLNYSYQDKLRNLYSFFSSIYTEIELPYGFSYRLSFQPRIGVTKDYNFWPTSTIEGAVNHSGGYGTRDDHQTFEWMLDNLLKWNKKIGVHNFDLTLLYNSEKFQSWSSIQSGETISPNENLSFHALQSGSKLTVLDDDTYKTGDAMMARLNYTLMDRYLFTGSVRRDGYSAFGQKNPRATFPAFAFAWHISNEDFWKDNWLIDRMKLRLSWGINGNRDIGAYSALARLSPNLYYDGSAVQVGVYNSSLANANLAWEKTLAYNAGLDIGLLKNRVDISADFYLSKTKDLLMQRNLPRITGFDNIYANLGELSNRGVELSVNTVNFNRHNFRWNTSFVFSLNRNKIEKLFGDIGDYTVMGETMSGELPDYTNHWFPGQAIDRVWNYKILGVWQLDEAEEAAKYNQHPGDYKAVDINGDFVYREVDDKQFIGWEQPRYRLGLKNDFVFLKNFTASIFIRADLGHIGSIRVFKHESAGYDRTNGKRATPYWTPENPTNKYGRLNADGSMYAGGYDIYFPRSFVRIQDFTLSYNLPKNKIQKLRLNKVRLYGAVRNLYSFDKWEDWDPESGGSPMPRTFTLGIDFSL